MNDVYLSLGGNIGNCIATFLEAKMLIEAKIGVIAKQSALYQTKAWGMDNAPDFYNQVIEVHTTLPAEELLQGLLAIEKQLGRERNTQLNHYQNRLIDVDILFFNQETIQASMLEIPHPKLHLRNFVLVPLQEIAPNFLHPVLKKTVTELLEMCPDKNEIKKQDA